MISLNHVAYGYQPARMIILAWQWQVWDYADSIEFKFKFKFKSVEFTGTG